jgi:hypothetical protein
LKNLGTKVVLKGENMSTSSRDTLSRKTFSASSKGVPKLRNVAHKIRVNITDDTVIEYQRTHQTISHYIKISLDITPQEWAASAIQQCLLVQCLGNETHISFDYTSTSPELTDDQLLHKLELIIEDTLRQELNLIERLLLVAKDDFCPALIMSIVDRVSDFSEQTSEALSFNPDLFIIKNENVFIDWPQFIKQIINPIIARHDDFNAPISNQSFQFIDINRLKPLAAILGHTPSHLKKEHWWAKVNLIKVGPITDTFDEDLVDALLNQAHTVLLQLQAQPMGYLFKESVSLNAHQFDGLTASKKMSTAIMRADRKRANMLRQLGYAETLIEVGFAERLRLTISQGIYWKAIYFETLTAQLLKELNAHVANEFKIDKLSEDILSFVDTANPDDFFSNYCETRNVDKSFSPSLLSLKINASIIKFFRHHPWLYKINCQQPKTFILDRIDADKNGDVYVGGEEYILTKQFFINTPIPKNPEILFHVGNFKTQTQGSSTPPNK